MKIDAHQHFWNLQKLPLPWLAEMDGVVYVDRAAFRGLKAVAEADLALDLVVNPARLKDCNELFEAEPMVRRVINHLALPPLKTGEIQPWQVAMRQAAQYPNVYCKVSGLVTLVNPDRDFEEQVRPVFENGLEYFGPERLLWGSDWPVCLQAASYGQVHQLLAALSPGYRLSNRPRSGPGPPVRSIV